MDNNPSTRESFRHIRVKIVRKFIDTTTLHGLGRIFTSRTKFQRYAWFLLVITGVVYVSYTTVDSVRRYYSYPTTTKVRLIYDEESVFPAVTICNRNKYMKKRALKKYPKLVSYYEKTGAKKEDVNISSEQMERIFDDIGQTFTKTVKLCRWASNRCPEGTFTPVVVENFGLCFTFNSGKQDLPALKVPSAGRYFGLKVDLNIQQDDSLAGYAAGAMIFIHDQNEPIDIGSMGIATSPGTSTIISVLKTKISNLPKPYETACEELEIPGYKKYTKAACTANCFYKHIVRRCGCKKEGYIGPARICSFYERVTCVVDAQEEFRLHVAKKCSCPEPCESIVYKASSSQFTWPTDAQVRVYEKRLRNRNMTFEQYKNFLRRNMAQISVFFKTMNYQSIQQIPTFSSIDLFGSIGGLVGLFLGGSLLTLFEFCELLCDLCFVSTKRPKYYDDDVITGL